MKGKIAGIAIVVVLIGVGAFYALNPSAIPTFDVSTVNTGATPSGTQLPTDFQVYGNNFNFMDQVTDALDVAITYGEDAELDTICWDANGSDDTDDWDKMPGGSLSEAETGDANIDLDNGRLDADGNIISTGTTEMWCEFNLESSQDFFVDQDKIVRANDRIDSCIWVDANDDTDGTWACRYDLIGLTSGDPNPNQEPSDTIDVYLFDEDTDGTIMDTAVASAASVAQGDTETEILTHLDLTGNADVVVISDIRFRNNLTSATAEIFNEQTEICFNEDSTARVVWFESRQEVGCIQLEDTSFFDKDAQASTTEYFWTSGSNYKDGILVMVPKNANQQVDITTKYHSAFTSATDSICNELAFKYIDGFETKSSFDAVDYEVTSDAVGDECTIT